MEFKELAKLDLYQCFANSPDIIRFMEKYQQGDMSRRKLCEEIVRLMHGWGFGRVSITSESRRSDFLTGLHGNGLKNL